jgi:hypothetical protein
MARPEKTPYSDYEFSDYAGRRGHWFWDNLRTPICSGRIFVIILDQQGSKNSASG